MKCLPPGGIHLRCAGHQARPWEFHDEQPLSLCAFLTGESYVAGNLVKSYEIAIVISAQIPDKVTSFGWKEGGCTGMVGWGQTEGPWMPGRGGEKGQNTEEWREHRQTRVQVVPMPHAPRVILAVR